ncbi:MAG: riboflavin synthase subunit alpha [Epulopiscium sp. Nele67-Bin001]|nr:MAG: riboflavin synthase subunit alpha [Epulopiscium sp. Nele67-Bin001]
MFTGIIEAKASIKRIIKKSNGLTFTIARPQTFDDIKIGDSIATNGVCLTITQLSPQTFDVDIMNESLKKTTLSTIGVGTKVNLERAMLVSSRFGGHIVSGHVDEVGRVVNIKKDGIATVYWIKVDNASCLISKGSVALDGISLTIVEVRASTFSVSIIPHTQQETTISSWHVGSLINIEKDQLIKSTMTQIKSVIDKDFLLKCGF